MPSEFTKQHQNQCKIQNFLEGMLPDLSIMALLLQQLCFIIIYVPQTFVVINFSYSGHPPFRRLLTPMIHLMKCIFSTSLLILQNLPPDLMTKFKSADPHFIQYIKPNVRKHGGVFDGDYM